MIASYETLLTHLLMHCYRCTIYVDHFSGPGVQEIINSEIELTMKSFTVVLNKPDYELARANISAFTSHVSLRDGNMTMIGKLGSISMTDLTPHGVLYRERFKTIGDNALHFDIFK